MKKELIKTWKEATGLITEYFCEKQELPHDLHWPGNRIGEVVNIGDYFFNFSDILYDLEHDIPKGKIIEWYDYTLEMHYKGIDDAPNYQNWCVANTLSKF